MRSTNTKWWYLTGEFTAHTIKETTPAEYVSQILGFASAQSAPKAIQAELDRVARNRAELVKEIADAILPAISAGLTVTAEVDEAQIAERVRVALGPDFDALSDDINRPRTVS
jgi:hypothetical protein